MWPFAACYPSDKKIGSWEPAARFLKNRDIRAIRLAHQHQMMTLGG